MPLVIDERFAHTDSSVPGRIHFLGQFYTLAAINRCTQHKDYRLKKALFRIPEPLDYVRQIRPYLAAIILCI
jgi:hypothetical protein